MAQQLKRWESPRRKGRNDKGRGGSARQRQLRKQFKTLKKMLEDKNKPDDKNSEGRELRSLPSLLQAILPTLNSGIGFRRLGEVEDGEAIAPKYLFTGLAQAHHHFTGQTNRY